ncbi:serpin family protein [Echinicola jeungdonensis]|uniref:Serpin family protein n=1 Tax=Echinicola jeungdonensis TaxID=709343 RepID=A0ABV5J5R7_9BACT|nr:serpin family protein [Echinicola jeungdonensis]MDN3670047.1 serpin family protein [Echinicola jeungdonensis]
MKYTYYSILTLFFLLVSCVDESPNKGEITPNLRALEETEKKLVNAGTAFSVRLFQQLSKEEGNLFFSPFSIHQALSMAMNGNKEELLEEYLETLHFDNISLEDANLANQGLTKFLKDVDPNVKINIANSIWYQEGLDLKSQFQETLQMQYLATISSLDMQSPGSKEIINQWVDDQTEGLIQDLIDQVDPAAVMYLINAIYYYGDWKYQFDPQNTTEQPFHISSSQTTPVEMMRLEEATTLKTYQANGFKYLEIPYSTGQYIMGVLLPDAFNLEEAKSNFNLNNLHAWREEAKEGNIKLEMPKFKMKIKIQNLKEDLIEMGLSTPFQQDPRNFTEIFETPTEPLKISRVIHEALIEVDEKGTEAAAATAVEVVVTSVPAEPPVIRLDRPFVFFIQEKHSGTILFMGVLKDPSKL